LSRARRRLVSSFFILILSFSFLVIGIFEETAAREGRSLFFVGAPKTPNIKVEVLNNDIFGIFSYVIFGIFKNNAYLCNIKQQVKHFRTPAATGNSGTRL